MLLSPQKCFEEKKRELLSEPVNIRNLKIFDLACLKVKSSFRRIHLEKSKYFDLSLQLNGFVARIHALLTEVNSSIRLDSSRVLYS
mmetsp:Transcript_4571/g.6768  ORF Transcript_4571/g.6768 Transcript_4571/m.6768 type:complete len:86 (-) Transcript_4571:44-301(-)